MVGIFLLLQAAFGSWRLASPRPRAAAAGPSSAGLVVAGPWTASDLSLGATLAGLFAVFAIAVHGLVALVRHLQLGAGGEGAADAVLRGARERLVPVVVTAVLTACAVLPLALLGDIAGNEITQPFRRRRPGWPRHLDPAAVLVTPALYLHVRRAPAPRRPRPTAPAAGRPAADLPS